MRIVTEEKLNKPQIEKHCQDVFTDPLLSKLSQRHVSFVVKKKGSEYQVVFQIDQSYFGFAKFKSQSNNLSSAFSECEKKAKRWVKRCKNMKSRHKNTASKYLHDTEILESGT